MTDLRETVNTLAAACRSAGLDPEQVFVHLTRRDLDSYADTLSNDPEWTPEHTVVAMRAVLDAVAAGRCGCRNCGGWRQ